MKLSDASHTCNTTGAHLATAKDATENENLVKVIDESGRCCPWLHVTSTNGSWAWPDGDDVTWSNWEPGQPIGSGYECVFMESTGKWWSNSCQGTRHFICTKPPSLKPGQPVLTVDNSDPVDGDTVTFTCTTGQSDVETYEIVLDGSSTALNTDTRTNTYSVAMDTSGVHNGAYTCTVLIDDVASEPSSSRNIAVRPKTPTLTASPSNSTLKPGMTILFTCETGSAGSQVIYTFLHNSNRLQSGLNSTYELRSVSPPNSGSYTCVVSVNYVDSHPSVAHNVLVKGPRPPKKSGSSGVSGGVIALWVIVVLLAAVLGGICLYRKTQESKRGEISEEAARAIADSRRLSEIQHQQRNGGHPSVTGPGNEFFLEVTL